MTDSRYILIAEDDPHEVELLKASFHELDLAQPLVFVNDGASLVEHLQSVGASDLDEHQPAVILLDIRMPRMNGIQALKQIKSHGRLRKIPVVMFSSSSQPDEIRECYDLGANAYVVKPVESRSYRDVMKGIGTFWGVVNQSCPAA